MDPPDVDALQAELREVRAQLRIEHLRLALVSPPHQHLADALETLAELRHDRVRGVYRLGGDADVTDKLIGMVGDVVTYWRGIVGEDRLTEMPSAGRLTD